MPAWGLLAGMVLSAGCAWQRYEPAALDREHVAQTSARQGLADADLGARMTQLGAVSAWPPAAWTPMQLGLVAALRSPAVRDARALVGSARAGRAVAARRANPNVALALEHHGDKDGDQAGHWSVGPSIEFSLSPQSRRRIAVALAGVAVVAARVEVLERAWQARDAGLVAALDVLEQRNLASLAAGEEAARAAVVASARAEVAAGVDYAFEWQTLELEANDARLARLDLRRAQSRAEAALAQSLMVTTDALDGLTLSATPAAGSLDYAALQAHALNEHPRVLRALADYDQAEHALAMAVAEQYPELRLSPGYFFDQGDNVWSLVGGVVVPLFASHDATIRQASVARDAAREYFHAVQATTLAELRAAWAEWQAALANDEATHAVARDIEASVAALHARERDGLVDKLVVARARLQQAQLASHLAASAASTRRARAALEMTARAPLDDAPFARYLNELHAEDERLEQTRP